MGEAWPWLALAGAGALHGLNPASGWIFGAVCGPRALLPLAAGHLAAIAAVALAVAAGLDLDRPAVLAGAAVLLVLVLLRHALRHERHRTPHAGLLLWSFIASTGHGAGLMLVPALVPLCTGGASSALPLALAAIALHLAAMLATGALLAVTAGAARRRLRRAAWPARPGSAESPPVRHTSSGWQFRRR